MFSIDTHIFWDVIVSQQIRTRAVFRMDEIFP